MPWLRVFVTNFYIHYKNQAKVKSIILVRFSFVDLSSIVTFVWTSLSLLKIYRLRTSVSLVLVYLVFSLYNIVKTYGCKYYTR